MKQTFTQNEINFLILIVILTLLRGGYNLYVLYTTKDDNTESAAQKISEKATHDYSFFSIVQLIISILYLFSSLYFLINGKIKTTLFAIVCLFMFIRAIAYFMVRFLGDIPFITNSDEPIYIYNSFMVNNFIMFFVSAYFIKVIFLG